MREFRVADGCYKKCQLFARGLAFMLYDHIFCPKTHGDSAH